MPQHNPNGNQDDHTELQWVSVEEDDGRSRFRVLGVAVMLLVVMTGLPFLATSGAAASNSFTANDVSVSTNSGMLKSLTVAPNGTITYNGLEKKPSDVRIVVEVRKDSSSTWHEVTSQTTSASNLEGSVDYSFAKTDLLDNTPLDKQQFRPSDDDTKTTTLDLRVSVTLVDAGPNGNDVTTNASNTFDVTVTNEKAGAGVGGKGNTNGNGK